ncbi:hypothetical protein IJD15_07440 [bacterium]|nr:hypothetical protein [bacterium]
MIITQINLINTNIKKNPFNKQITVPFLKEGFDLQNKDIVSFGRKKTKEKVDKNKIYKQLRKAGCGEKDTNSIINNDKKYKHLLSLMENAKNFEREITPKEMVAIVSNEFDDEQTKRFIYISGDNVPATRKLSSKEAVAVIKNKVDNAKIQRFIDLKTVDEAGNSLLSRPLTNSEACLICNEDFDDIQAQTYIRLNELSFYFRKIEFIKDKNNVKRFIELTKVDEQGQGLLSRVPTDEEAVMLTIEGFDNIQSQRIIDLLDNKLNFSRALTYNESKAIVKGELEEKDVQTFIDTKSYLEDRNSKRQYDRVPSDKGIVLAVKQKFDKQKINIFYELTNKFFETEATAMVTDGEKYSRILSLTKPKEGRPLSLYEAGSAIKNDLSDTDVEIYKDLIDSKVKNYEALAFVGDKNKTKKYLQFTSKDLTTLSRALTPDEAHLSISKEFSENKIQELINLKDSNPELKYDYIVTLLDFVEYKNNTNISELSSKGKRNLLKLLVKHNASLFNTDISASIYPLVPKNQKEYCTLLPALTKAIGINTKPLSEQEKAHFFDGIKGLTEKINTNSDLTLYLDLIYQAVPEIESSNIIESLQVIEEMGKNPKFKGLEQEDKNILTVATLLKSLSNNPQEASFDAFYIMQRFNLSEDKQLKIYELIKTSRWNEQLANAKDEDVDKIAQDIAFETRHSNTFELSKILCEAELKAYNKIQSLEEMKDLAEKIDFYLKKLQETQIFLPQTKIPKASEMKNCQELTSDGITNTVLYINRTDKPLSEYGFEEGTTLENWQGLVHGLDTEQQLQIFTTFSLIDSEALLSSSYMNPREYKVFRKQGLILDVNPNDIHAGYFKDFGSGFKKDIEGLKRHYLFNDKQEVSKYERNKSQYRTYIPNLIKRQLSYSDDDYLKIIKNLQGCKSITDVEFKNKEFAQALLRLFETIHFGERKYNRQYNEILISRPKIQGVFSYGQKYEDIPFFLRKYASENNFPIIIFGNN